jgi:hypothetical protein
MTTERICKTCRRDPATGKMGTCVLCRSSGHRWESREDEEVIQRYINLLIYQRRMEQFAVIDEDSGRVRRVRKQELVDKGIMCFRGLKRRTAAQVAHVKHRAKKRSEHTERRPIA